MKNLRNLFRGAKDRYATRTAKGTFLSLLLTTCAAFTACTEKEDFNVDNNKLQVTFGVNSHGSRAINRETSLPDGSQVGARLSGYTGYENLVYTASTGKTPQTWTGDKDVVLSDVSGTLYAFYPYEEDVDITAIPVDMTAADQTDWLYGVPATGITDLNPEVNVTMNHALANINLSIVRDTYAGTGAITSISVQSDGIASKGTFNAAQATPGYTAFTGEGAVLERSVNTTLGATASDIMVVPTGTEAPITFFVTVDDVLYTVKSAPLTLEMGNSYQYTLKLNSTFMSVNGVSVTPWNNVPKEDDLELEEYNPWTDIANGVYAVSAGGKLVNIDEADETCIAAALVVNDAPTPQYIMIAKYNAVNEETAYQDNLYYLNYTNDCGLTKYTTIDGEETSSSFYGVGVERVSLDYLTWTEGAISDFDGKGNTTVLVDKSSNIKEMCDVLKKFNNANNKTIYGDNYGYTDWYVPAYGQLALMYLNITEINQMLTKIGGTAFKDNYYWSSSEYNNLSAWSMTFNKYGFISYSQKNHSNFVRFVRDIN